MTCICHACGGRDPVDARAEYAGQKKIPAAETEYRLATFDRRHAGGKVFRDGDDEAVFYDEPKGQLALFD